MSLIRVRRERKKAHIDARKGLSTQLLIFLLIVVAVAIWVVPQWLESVVP